MDIRILDANGSWISALLFPATDLLKFVLLCGDGGIARSRSSGLCFRLDQGWQRLRKRLACLRQHDSILWALGSGETRFDGGKIKTQQLGVFRLGRLGIVENSLLAGVGFDERDLLVAAAGEFQVAQAFFVDRKDAAGGAVLGSHIRNRRTISERQVLQAGAEVLDELPDNSVVAKHLGDSENKVGCSGAFTQTSGKLHADDERDQH